VAGFLRDIRLHPGDSPDADPGGLAKNKEDPIIRVLLRQRYGVKFFNQSVELDIGENKD
jgi:hypothetical protein